MKYKENAFDKYSKNIKINMKFLIIKSLEEIK